MTSLGMYAKRYGTAKGAGYTGKIAASFDGSLVFALRHHKFSGFRKKDMPRNSDVDDVVDHNQLRPHLRILFGGTCLAFCTTPTDHLLAIVHTVRGGCRTTLYQFTFYGSLARKVELSKGVVASPVIGIAACQTSVAYATDSEVHICDAEFAAPWRVLPCGSIRSICWTEFNELAVQTDAHVCVFTQHGTLTLLPAARGEGCSIETALPFTTPVVVYNYRCTRLTYEPLRTGNNYAYFLHIPHKYPILRHRKVYTATVATYWRPGLNLSLHDLHM